MGWRRWCLGVLLVLVSQTAAPAATVTLRWDYNDQGQTGFQLYRCTGLGCTNSVPRGDPLGAAARDTQDVATQGEIYQYSIVALGDDTTTTDSQVSTPPLVVEVPVAGVGTHLHWLTQPPVPPASTFTNATLTPAPQVEVLDGYDNLVTTSTASVTVALPSGEFLPIAQSQVTFVSVSSEETVALPGDGPRAVDGNPQTFWHNHYYPDEVPFPNILIVDLRTPYLVTGFRYLPQQASLDYGRIAEYEFHVSQDGVTWGTAVSSGTLANDGFTANEVRFMGRTARYVRLMAKSEVGGRQLTAVAELTTLYSLTGGGALAGTLQVDAVAGVATFANLHLTQAGTYTMNATSAGLTGATSTQFSVVDAPEIQELTGPLVRRLGQ